MKSNPLTRLILRIRDAIENRLLDLVDALAPLRDRMAGVFSRSGRRAPIVADEVDHRMAANLVETGRKYYNSRRYHKAERCFRKAIRSDESYGLAHYYQGLALYRMNLPKAASVAWNRTIEVAPDSEIADKATRKLERKLVYRNRSEKAARRSVDPE
ncbi:MAG: hypothetical protein IID08_00355 [Candidatus Hydrogenedentes bacterium]|nr:hypothetical protein [Candidatus Hydrogenedentota bacterium]